MNLLSTVVVKFSVTGLAHPGDGDISILGSCRQLGSWDETKAIPLVKTSGNLWEVSLSLTFGETVQYKYVERRKQKVVAWETMLGNRCLVVGMRNITAAQHQSHTSTQNEDSEKTLFKTRQSSTYVGKKEPFAGARHASTAINGITSGHKEYLCSHTELDDQAWWDIDLNQNYNIEKIILWNRTGNCSSRLVPFWVLLSDLPFPPWRSSCLNESRNISKYEVRVEELHDLYEIDVTQLEGGISCRYCRIQLENENYLHMSEVQLWERVPSATTTSHTSHTSHTSQTTPTTIENTPIHKTHPTHPTHPETRNMNGNMNGNRKSILLGTHDINDGELTEMDSVWLGSHQSEKGDNDLITLTFNSDVNEFEDGEWNTKGKVLPSIQINATTEEDEQQIQEEKDIEHTTINTCATKTATKTRNSIRCTTMFQNESPQILPIHLLDDEDWLSDVLRCHFHFSKHHSRNNCSIKFEIISHSLPSNPSSSSSSFSNDETKTNSILNSMESTSTATEIIGTGYVSMTQLNNTSRGRIVVPIFSAMHHSHIIGSLSFTYTIAKAYLHPNNTLENVFRTHWQTRQSSINRRNSTLDVGHRGLGKSEHSEYRLSAIRENSLMSFIVAGRLGADFIEFDVLLTQDRVPVVFHDFELNISMKENNVRGINDHRSSEDQLIVGVHQLNWRQLSRAKTEFKSKHPSKLRELIKRHFEKILSMTPNGRLLLVERKKRRLKINKWGDTTPRLAAVLESIPTLRSLFYSVPIWVGFNIEIKYPIEKKHSHLRDLIVYECNTYLDTILECIFNHAGNRRIVFSCFDPDVCMLLHAKQPRYPVLFLTGSGTHQDFRDATCLSLKAAWTFAKAQDLQGIVAESTPILKNHSIVNDIKKNNLLLFTWGDKNTELTNVIVQKNLGVDGIISDNIGDLTRMQGKKHNIYRDDLLLANVPELMPKNPEQIAGFNAFRENYRSFRVGKARGAKGELSRFVPGSGSGSSGVSKSPPRSPIRTTKKKLNKSPRSCKHKTGNYLLRKSQSEDPNFS